MRKTTKAALTAVAVMTATACLPSQGGDTKATTEPPAQAPASKPMTAEERQREIERRTAIRGDRANAATPVDKGANAGELPALVEDVPADIVDPMKADLAVRIGEAAKKARIVHAEQVTWPDGSIGCPKPGMLYTQALVPGYLVQFEVDGKAYRYHSSLKGNVIFCERPGPYIPAGGPAQ